MWHALERREKCTRMAGGVEWIQLAQDRDRWRDLMNAVMNLWVLEPRS
jgi:hypothetical protein